jgi:hypothetical protein
MSRTRRHIPEAVHFKARSQCPQNAHDRTFRLLAGHERAEDVLDEAVELAWE